jgi:hypothetical protein
LAILVERSFTIQRGGAVEFERLSREAIWPYMEARGCKILGLYANVHGGPSNELTLLTAYDSLAHWEATRQDSLPPEGSSDELLAMHEANIVALRERAKLTVVSSSRVLRPITPWFDLSVRPG